MRQPFSVQLAANVLGTISARFVRLCQLYNGHMPCGRVKIEQTDKLDWVGSAAG